MLDQLSSSAFISFVFDSLFSWFWFVENFIFNFVYLFLSSLACWNFLFLGSCLSPLGLLSALPSLWPSETHLCSWCPVTVMFVPQPCKLYALYSCGKKGIVLCFKETLYLLDVVVIYSLWETNSFSIMSFFSLVLTSRRLMSNEEMPGNKIEIGNTDPCSKSEC